jgi:hypothetical protein
MARKIRKVFELTEKQLEKLKYIPTKCQNVFRNAFKGNRPAAVKANCLECMGYSRAEVYACNTETCPMHKLRPFQNLAKRSKNDDSGDLESKSD